MMNADAARFAKMASFLSLRAADGKSFTVRQLLSLIGEERRSLAFYSLVESCAALVNAGLGNECSRSRASESDVSGVLCDVWADEPLYAYWIQPTN